MHLMIMKQMMKYSILLLLFFLFSCSDSKKKNIASILKEWEHKEILFPCNPIFSIQGKDTVAYPKGGEYKVFSYVDSMGCISCKLKLDEWQKFITDVDSLCPNTVQFLFYFNPKKRSEICRILQFDKFKYPVCIDEQDSINKLNHFSSETMFQTFLLDRENKVIAVGNPIHNSKVKELYLSVILGKESSNESDNQPQTTAKLSEAQLNLGEFPWKEKQRQDILITNTGDNPLAINEVVTSCGGTTVEYDKQPVLPGKSIPIKVYYQAGYPEHFNKTITVHCNAKNAPFMIKISGDAK